MRCLKLKYSSYRSARRFFPLTFFFPLASFAFSFPELFDCVLSKVTSACSHLEKYSEKIIASLRRTLLLRSVLNMAVENTGYGAPDHCSRNVLRSRSHVPDSPVLPLEKLSNFQIHQLIIFTLHLLSRMSSSKSVIIFQNIVIIIIIIIIAQTAVFNVAGYLIEERRRWPVITGDNIPNKFRILKERHIQMRKAYQLPGWTKNSSYYSAPVRDRTHDLPPP